MVSHQFHSMILALLFSAVTFCAQAGGFEDLRFSVSVERKGELTYTEMEPIILTFTLENPTSQTIENIPFFDFIPVESSSPYGETAFLKLFLKLEDGNAVWLSRPNFYLGDMSDPTNPGGYHVLASIAADSTYFLWPGEKRQLSFLLSETMSSYRFVTANAGTFSLFATYSSSDRKTRIRSNEVSFRVVKPKTEEENDLVANLKAMNYPSSSYFYHPEAYQFFFRNRMFLKPVTFQSILGIYRKQKNSAYWPYCRDVVEGIIAHTKTQEWRKFLQKFDLPDTPENLATDLSDVELSIAVDRPEGNYITNEAPEITISLQNRGRKTLWPLSPLSFSPLFPRVSPLDINPTTNSLRLFVQREGTPPIEIKNPDASYRDKKFVPYLWLPPKEKRAKTFYLMDEFHYQELGDRKDYYITSNPGKLEVYCEYQSGREVIQSNRIKIQVVAPTSEEDLRAIEILKEYEGRPSWGTKWGGLLPLYYPNTTAKPDQTPGSKYRESEILTEYEMVARIQKECPNSVFSKPVEKYLKHWEKEASRLKYKVAHPEKFPEPTPSPQKAEKRRVYY